MAQPSQRLEEVVVMSSPLEQTLFDFAQPATVLSGAGLETKAQASLGETLSGEPGVSSSYFGPGASRPVIRGLGGDRIRILENGIGSQDLSGSSPDHAVSVDPALVDRIEVVRGPAALLYGTSAVGGIVNVFDHRIPEEVPDRPLAGSIEARGGTVDEERAGVLDITAPAGPFALHFDGLLRKSDDYSIPGFARTARLRDSQELEFPEPRGKVPFSATDTDNLTLGSSYVFGNGYIGAAVSEFNSLYGVPNGEKDISIDLERRRLDVKGALRNMGDVLKSAELKIGVVDYTHTEFEGPDPGTKLDQDAFDGRIDFAHAPLGPFEGLFGLAYQATDFEAVGEEAFQPPTDSDVYSLFLFESVKISDGLSLQLGARYDNHSVDSAGFESFPEDDISRDFDTFSQSAGLVWGPGEEYVWALSLAHTERAPNGQELFANGPHVATAAFEIGDPDLDPERSLGVDLSLRKKSGFLRGSLGGYYNRFWDYISLNPNGEVEDDFPVFEFEAVSADFVGFEAQVALFPIDEPGRELSFDFQADYVRARDRDKDDSLPRIPPLRMRAGANFYDAGIARARLELQHVFEQDRTADFETSTSGYTFLNAYLSKEIAVDEHVFELFLRGSNLLNDKARDHVSFIKDVAPLPGASVLGGVRVSF